MRSPAVKDRPFQKARNAAHRALAQWLGQARARRRSAAGNRSSLPPWVQLSIVLLVAMMAMVGHAQETGAVTGVDEREGDPLVFHEGAYRPLS